MMAHPHEDDARKFRGNKLNEMVGKRGEYPPDRASRIAGVPQTNANAQGEAARSPPEVFIGAPARQVSNYGSVRK
jgi:hypothetical protein